MRTGARAARAEIFFLTSQSPKRVSEKGGGLPAARFSVPKTSAKLEHPKYYIGITIINIEIILICNNFAKKYYSPKKS